MDEQKKKLIERVTKKQQRFWIRLFTILVSVFLMVSIVGTTLVSYVSRHMERKEFLEAEGTLENFIGKKFKVDIPLHYEFSMDMGLEIVTFRRATVTCYNNEKHQTDDTPNHTATGRMVVEGSIAASQDIFRKKLQPGDIVYVMKLKRYFVLEDTMNARHKNCFDIFFYKQNKGKMYNTFTSDIVGLRLK